MPVATLKDKIINLINIDVQTEALDIVKIKSKKKQLTARQIVKKAIGSILKFVQEVFPEKRLPENVEFVLKNKNSSKSKITNSKSASKYWINTPLKKIKN